MAKKKMEARGLRLGWKLSGLLAAAVVCAAGVSVTTRVAAKEQTQEETIADNIYIGSIPVGGLTEVQAAAAVDEYVKTLDDTQFTLHVDGKSVVASGGALGLEWSNRVLVKDALGVGRTGNLIERYKSKKDLEHENLVYEMTYTADEQKVKQFLEENTQEMNQDAVNYGLKRENGTFTITDGQNGVAVDVEKSAEAIISYIEESWTQENASIALTAKVVEPEGTKEQLSRVQDVLGTFTTNFGSSAAGRAQNVRTGAEKINGHVVYPGEQFSVYEVVNPFTEENGYALAGSYENGTTVQSYGGGICQVSTTLYNAVIRAELAIDERYCHSMIVSYVQPSMDAAIAGTYKDLKFTNNKDVPIYIEGSANGGVLTFTIYGEETRPANREVVYESETTSTTQPETKYVASREHAIGYINVQQSSHVGYTAKLWKVVKENGVEVSREQYNSSTYNASPRIVTVGISSSNSSAVAAVQAAIATKNESTIRSVVAANTASALQAKEDENKKNEEETQEPDEKTDDTKADEPKKDDAKKDDVKKEDSNKEDTKKEDTKKEDTKKDEPKKEETKKDEDKSDKKEESSGKPSKKEESSTQDEE